MPYRHLTLEERRTLFRLLNAKVPVAEIANQLGRHRSTIFREIRRNLFRDVKEYRGYVPITADDSANLGMTGCVDQDDHLVSAIASYRKKPI